MASGSQNMTTFKANVNAMMKVGLPSAGEFAILNTTAYTADQLGATDSLAIVNTPITGRPLDNHGAYLSIASVNTPFQLMLADTSNRYIWKRYKTSAGWQAWFKLDAGHADTWTTARTLTVGGTGKSVDGSANVSWSMNDIMGSSDSNKFYRGDKTWSNSLTSDISIGSRGTTSAPSSLTAVNRITIVPYFHTGGPWYIKSEDDNTNAYLSLFYGSSRIIKTMHNGDLTCGLINDWKFAAVSALNANDVRTSNGLWAVANSITNAAHTNHSLLLGVSNVGTPFQLQIPDSSVFYIYKRYYNGGAWSGWTKIYAGYADSAGSVAWGNVTDKPSTFTPSSHTHSYLPLSGGVMTGAIQFNSRGGNSIYNGPNDNTYGVGGALNNLVISSWWGVSFTTSCGGQTYSNKNAVSIDCRSGFLYAAAVHNAVWNDLAEQRKSYVYEPGYAIAPSGHRTSKRLESGACIISDTYGMCMGEIEGADNLAPVGLAGRVLAYPLHDKSYYEVGDAVCAAEGGKIDKMTRDEIKEYPDRIIGIVNEIPDYDIWEPSREGGGREPIHTNGRIWIDVR